MSPGWRRLLAAVEAVGGLAGSWAVAADLARRPAAPTDAVLIGVFLLAMFAGVTLWLDAPGGRAASVAVQLAQLPKVLTGSVAVMVSVGLDFAPMVMSSRGPAGYGVALDFRVGEYHLLAVNPVGLPAGFGVSVVSCLALWGLLRRPVPPADPPRQIESADAVAAILQQREVLGRAKRASG